MFGGGDGSAAKMLNTGGAFGQSVIAPLGRAVPEGWADERDVSGGWI